MFNSLSQKGKIVLNLLKPRRGYGRFVVFGFLSAVMIAVFLGVNYASAQIVDPGAIARSIAETFGNIMLWFAAKINGLTIIIVHFVIELASYNNYINSQAVNLGWVLVRDVTNMLFVVILMAIAFGTVLGIEQYEWKKLLVKFVLAAILVNFSRIICGVIIDAAQVFMMTFISGVAAIAGGNLMNALQMESITSLAGSFDPSSMAETGNMVATAVVVLVFSFAAMMIIGAYLIMLLARIVALWVLIVLSPLAYVLGVIPKFSSYAQEWWKEFTNNVLTGPVLAFFLWLAFAVAGGGNIYQSDFGAQNASYPMTDFTSETEAVSRQTGESGTNLNKILEAEYFANFIIATAMLLVGVKVTQRLSGVGAGVLGTAAGVATKFAAVAGGLTAAKWVGGQALRGGKYLGKTTLMKAPLVGGDAWVRAGRRVKARAQYKVGEFQKSREALIGKMYKASLDKNKSGLGRLVAGAGASLLATSKQKEKRVKFLEQAVENLGKERDESLGVGSLKEGRLSGKQYKSYELAKKESDEAKEIGLTHPLEEMLRERGRISEADEVASKRAQMEIEREVRKAGSIEQLKEDIASGKSKFELDKLMQTAQRQQVADSDLSLQKRIAEGEAKARVYENQGRHDMAQLIRGAVSAETNKELNQAYGNLDSADLIAMFQNKINKREDIKNQLVAAEQAGNTDLANKLEDQLVDSMRDLHNFKTNTMQNDYVRKEINRLGQETAGYSGTNALVDAKKSELSVLTGFDAHGGSQADKRRIERMMGKMSQLPGMQDEFKRRANFANQLAAKGDFREAVLMDSGIQQNAVGQFTTVRGMQRHIGDFGTDGKQRTPVQKNQQSYFEVDTSKIDFYKTEKMDFSNLYDHEIIFTGVDANTGQVKDVDNDVLESIGHYLSTKNINNINSAIPKKIFDAWSDLKSKGKLDKVLADKIVQQITAKISDNRVKDKLKQGLLAGLM